MGTVRSARYDAIIVGARVAGAATALLLARRGHRVLVVDRDRRGRDTLSTHALMRAAVVQLQRWGLLDRVVATGVTPVHRVTFHYGDEPVAVEIAEPLYAPRRIVLDEILIAAAEEAGAEIRFGVDVRAVTRDAHGRVTGVRGRDERGATFTATASTTIGADGRNSLVARLVDAPITRASVVHSAVLYGYWDDVEARGYEWCFNFVSRETRAGASGPQIQAIHGTATTGGLIPTNDGQVCVWAGMSPERFDALRGDREAALHTILAETTSDVARRAASGTRRGPIRGFVGLPGILRRPWGPGWALVGDAGYFKDPLTSHGISDALRDAELLARALDTVFTGLASEAAALSGYEHVRDDLSIPLFDATARIASYNQDLTQLKRLHRTLSTEMQRETRFLRSLDAAPLAGAGAAR
jgi:flavin-dependent dehydrogenase